MSKIRDAGLEKNASQQIDDVATVDKHVEALGAVGGDYSGAVAKSDPKEIALVRKLDMRIMPALFAIYFL